MISGYPETYVHKGAYLHHGGDQNEYIAFAQDLANFELVDSYRTLGYPLYLVPFMWIFGADGFDDILLPVTIFQACVLFPLSIILVALTAEKLTKSRWIALVTAALWTTFPDLLKLSADIGIYMSTHDPEALQARFIQTQTWMVHQTWGQVLSDPLSSFLSILCIYLFLLSLQSSSRIGTLAGLSGISSALAFLVRPQEAMLAIVCCGVYAIAKQLKAGLMFCVSYGIVLLPQVAYNLAFKDYLLFGYSSTFHNYSQAGFDRTLAMEAFKHLQFDSPFPPTFSLKYAWVNLHLLDRSIPFAPVFLGVFIGMVLLTFLVIYKVKKEYGLFFIAWIFAYSAFLVSYIMFFLDFRFLMSVIPMYLLVFATHLIIVAHLVSGLRVRHKKNIDGGGDEAKS